MGHVCIDCAWHGLAQLYFAGAQAMADQAKDRSTHALVLSKLAEQAQSLGHRRMALSCAEAAWGELPAHATPSVRWTVSAQLAVSRASVGQRQSALDAAALSHTAAENATDEEPCEGCSPAALAHQMGLMLGEMSDLRGAIRELRRAVALHGCVNPRGQALSAALLAELLLRTGHLEEACESWERFSHVRARLDSAAVDRAADRMQGMLRPYAHHAAARRLCASLSTAPSNSVFGSGCDRANP